MQLYGRLLCIVFTLLPRGGRTSTLRATYNRKKEHLALLLVITALRGASHGTPHVFYVAKYTHLTRGTSCFA